MKTLTKLFFTFCIVTSLFFSCDKDSEVEDNTGTGSVEFNLNSSLLKSSSTIDFDAISKVVLKLDTTGNEEDSITEDYIELELYKMSDSFYTDDLVLTVGEYNLTQFFIKDTTDNIIYACPLSGSTQAANVDNPLPISFTVSKDKVTSVDVEVLSTEGLEASDFGLSVFNIDFVSTFSFIMSTIDSLSYVPISSALTIVSGSDYSYTQELDSTLTNVLQIKDGFDSYDFTFTKDGYESRTITFYNEELKEYTSNVLTVKLLSESALSDSLVAKYNLDGDVKDYSGNAYNLSASNVEYITDRNGNPSSACYFNGAAGATLFSQNVFNQSSAQSVSAWFKTTDLNNSSSYGGFLFVMVGSKDDGTGSRFSINMKNGYLRGNYGDGYSEDDGEWNDRVVTSDTYNDGNWHHVVYVSTGDEGTISLFVDGELVASKAVSRSNHSISTDLDFKIGGNNTNNYFTGAVDNVVYYHKALSTSEIQLLYAE